MRGLDSDLGDLEFSLNRGVRHLSGVPAERTRDYPLDAWTKLRL